MVIRVEADDSPAELAEKWRDALASFDAWTIHDAHGSSAETLGNGLVSGAFESAHEHGLLGVTQLYLAFRHRNRNPTSTIARIRDALHSRSVQVFYFRDGRIVFLDTHESVSVTRRRIEGKRLALYWCGICDAMHETLVLTSNPGKCWRSVDLTELIAIMGAAPVGRHISKDGKQHSG